METLLTPYSVQGCVQGGNNLVNTMELQCFPPCYKVNKHLVPLIKCDWILENRSKSHIWYVFREIPISIFTALYFCGA